MNINAIMYGFEGFDLSLMEYDYDFLSEMYFKGDEKYHEMFLNYLRINKLIINMRMECKLHDIPFQPLLDEVMKGVEYVYPHENLDDILFATWCANSSKH